MRNKKLALIVIGVLVLGTLASYAQTKQLKQLGRYTLVRVKGEVPTSEVMRLLMDRYAGDIKYGFDLAGYGDLYLPFLDQVKASAFKEGTLEIGDKMLWMLFRSHGKVKVVKDLEWAGKQPVPIFTFTVKKGYKHFELFIPRPCGNIALRKVTEIIPDAVAAIEVDPVKANLNDPVNVDMSGSQHAKSMAVEVFGPDGAKVADKALSPESPRWQTKFSVPGEYVFKGKAFNFEDKPSTNPCEAKTYINFPPTCKIWSSCNPCKNYVGRPVTFDASNSTDPDGEVVKVDFEIKDETGAIVDTFSDTEKPFAMEKIFEKPGMYTITAVVTDDFNAMSEPCKIEGLEVTQKRLFFMGSLGWQLIRGSHGNFLTPRLGLLYKIVPDRFSLIFSAGPGVSIANSDIWKSVLQAQALFNLHAGPAYFGVGAGFTTKPKEDRETDFDLVGQIGATFFDNFTLAGQTFLEVRAPLGDGRSFSDHHKLQLGFRLLF